MNRVKELSKAVKLSYNQKVKNIGVFFDKYNVIKKLYYGGIAANMFLAYQCLVKIVALS